MNPSAESSQPAQAAPSAELVDAEAASQAARRAVRKRNLRAGVASVVLIAIFVGVLRSGGFPLIPPAAELAKLQLGGFAVFCGTMLFHFLTRYARCHFLIAPLAKVPFRRIMTINAIGMAAITFLPLRLGEMARPAMLRDRGHLSAWAVTGTVGAERILDGLVFSGMLLLGLALAHPQSPLPDHVGTLPVPVWIVPRSATVASWVFVAAFFVMAGFYWFRAAARRLTERVVGLISVPLGRRVADIVERLSDGLRFLTNWRYSVPYLAVTLVSILALAVGIESLSHAAGLPELTFEQALVVLGVLALGFTAPNAPGFFGVVQLALYAGLATYITPERVALQGGVLVFVYYVTHLTTVSLLALIAFVIEFLVKAKQAARLPGDLRASP